MSRKALNIWNNSSDVSVDFKNVFWKQGSTKPKFFPRERSLKNFRIFGAEEDPEEHKKNCNIQ